MKTEVFSVEASYNEGHGCGVEFWRKGGDGLKYKRYEMDKRRAARVGMLISWLQYYGIVKVTPHITRMGWTARRVTTEQERYV